MIKYFKLDEIYTQKEKLMMFLLKKKPKKVYNPKLKTDPMLELFISLLMTIITSVLCLSIPLVVMDSPCEVLKEHKYMEIYKYAKLFEKYLPMVDRAVIALSIMLAFVSVVTIVDAIIITEIKSPWVEMGIYEPPTCSRKKWCVKVNPVATSCYCTLGN